MSASRAGGSKRGALGSQLVRVDHPARPLSDLYAFLLRARWPVVLGLAAGSFLAANVLFAALYFAVPDSIANADGSFSDAFFFSVQTFGAIGYGYMVAQGPWANAVVTVEAFVSLVFIAMLTGIVFAKFSRPTARVLFSRPILVEQRNAKPTLTFRVANERGNDIVEASIRVSVLLTEETAEGHLTRRFSDLRLERSSSPIFIMTWQIFHTIDEQSPLYGMTHQDIIDQHVLFTIALTGLDGIFAQTIHARHTYWPDDIVFGHTFEDVIAFTGIDEPVEVDLRKFHDTRPQRTDDGSGELVGDADAGS